MQVLLKKIGQWKEVTALSRGLKMDLKSTRSDLLKDWGHRAETIAKGHITTQDLGWEPLKESTIRRKKEENMPYIDEILRATSTYYNTIKFWVNAKGYQSDTVYVGVNDSDGHPSGEKLGEIAVLHEFGAWELNIPARPLWGPVLQEMATNHTEDLMRDALEVLALRLKRKYGLSTVQIT